MIKNMNVNIGNINEIIKKTIEELGNSREQILTIIDNVRNEYENLRSEFSKLKEEIDKVIEEVDGLEKQDRKMRQRLAEVSQKFNQYGEKEIKEVYDKAMDIKIRFITKTNEEKALKERRYRLELALKRTAENIENAEKVINQVSIALSYLEGDILAALEGFDNGSEMFIGIKVLEAQEAERKRIARDIHDGPAQYMANVVMKVDVTAKLMHRNVEEGLQELADLKESVKTALKEVRSIIFNLRPMALEELGLNNTITIMAKSIMEDAGIDVEFKLKPLNEEVELIIQVAIYRIIQEVFNNIRKHSKATQVAVKSDFGTKYISFIISENGVGFNVEETINRVKERGTSYGLLGLIDRVNQLQGEIRIDSSEGIGTVYNIKLPINREVINDES